LIASPEQKRVLKYYKYFTWLIPVLKIISPNIITTIRQMALAMIYIVQNGYERNVINVKDIKMMAEKA